MTKFKKISKSETIYVQGGLVSNGFWLFNIQWLLSIPRKRDTGIIPLKNRVIKAQSQVVMAKLNDESYPSYDLEKVLNAIDLSEYRPINRDKLLVHQGFIRGKAENFGDVALQFGANGPYLDIEYAVAANFDLSTGILVKDQDSPIILVNKNKEIVAAIAPLNPRKFKERK